MPRLALHWQIIIGLILGLLVGIVVNLAWGDERWAGLGVRHPASYVEGEPYKAPKPKKKVERAAREWLLAGLQEAYAEGAEQAPPLEEVVAPFADDDMSVEEAEDELLLAATWLVQPTLPETLNLTYEPPDEAVLAEAVEHLREQLSNEEQLGEQIEPPDPEETEAAAGLFASIVETVANATDQRITMTARPNENPTLGARSALFVRRAVEFVGDLFLRLLRFIAAPIVLFSLIVGAASLNDLRKLSRIGGKTIGIYIVTTAVAITVGLVLANLVRPGKWVPQEVRDEMAGKGVEAAAERIEAATAPNVWETMLNIVPTNPFGALAEGEMLQILFAALAVGIALTLIPKDKARPVIAFCDGMTDVIIKLVHVIMLTAPYAVFALIVRVVADLGLDVLLALIVYSVVVILGLAVMVFVVYPGVLRALTPMRYGRFFAGIAPAQLLAFSSSSSSATLPVTMECVEERLGVSEDVTSFAVPLGATINMDGTALYQGVAAVFIAQLYGLGLDLGQQLTIVLTATLASIGTAGVPGVGMIMLVIVLQAVGMPAEVMAGGLAIIFGVDRILDMCRTTCNVTGDCMVATVVASSEGELATAEEVRARREAARQAGLDEHPVEPSEDQYAKSPGPGAVGD